MKFPCLKRGVTRHLSVEALWGGCNRRDGAYHTADTQLVEAKNVWWNTGALRTRPAFGKVSDGVLSDGKAQVNWKFCSEDTIRGGRKGRRFLRRIYDENQGRVQLQVGVLTYDGIMEMEGFIESDDISLDAMIMDYPYSDTEDVLVFLSDGRIYAQDSNIFYWRRVDDEAYVPCVLVDGRGVKQLWDSPSQAGTAYEGRNMLTDRFCAKYTTTYDGFAFYFPYDQLDPTQSVEICITYPSGGKVEYTIPAGETECGFGSNGLKPQVDHEKGLFYFLSESGGLTAPLPGFANNMTVYASKKRSNAEKQLIASMRFCSWLGGSQAGCDSRQFISGSMRAPNLIYWSGLGQPLYFPESNYIAVGDLNQAITTFGKQDGQLVIFKEREIYSLSKPDGTVEGSRVDGQLTQKVTATTEYFPVTQLHAQVGCTAPQTVRLCGNRLCWADGTGDVYTLIGSSVGYTVKKLSSLLGGEPQKHQSASWNTAVAAILDGHYLLLVDSTVYVLRVDEKAFSRYTSAYSDTAAQQQLAWFIWELPMRAKAETMVSDGNRLSLLVSFADDTSVRWAVLQPLAGEDSVYRNDGWYTTPVNSVITTKSFDVGAATRNSRIVRVYIGMQGDENTQVTFAYHYDGKTAQDAVTATGISQPHVYTLTPNVSRVGRFGLTICSKGDLAVDSLMFSYR